MKKDEQVGVPKDMNTVLVGLGCTCRGAIDLDASIVCVDGNKQIQEKCYYGNLRCFNGAIRHAGDNLDGDGDGDDEVIQIQLDKIPENI